MSETAKKKIRLPLGQVVITSNALAKMPPPNNIDLCLGRHMAGDWGDMPPEDCRLNDAAVNGGDRIMSSYQGMNGTKFWIITEADRSVTTVLLPEDY